MKKSFLLLLAFVSFPCTGFSVSTVSLEPNWQLVTGGTPVTPPVRTEYGFAVMLDGRNLAAVSNTGKQLWQAVVPAGAPADFMGIGGAGFLFVVTGTNTLSLYNPSGLRLWSVSVPDTIKSVPLQGRDGRVFVQCENSIFCYGLNGTLKWETPAGARADFPLYELEDGSILHIQKKTIQGCSTGLRISPFGTILEEITFTGNITAAAGTNNGVILAFRDGSTGCCSSTANMSETKWSLPAGTVTNASSIIVNNTNQCAVISASGTSTCLTILDSVDGAILSVQTVPIQRSGILFASFDSDAVVLCDSNIAGAYSIQQETLWEVKIPDRKPWTYILYLQNGYLVLMEKNTWVTSAYRVTQHIGAVEVTPQPGTDNTTYQVYTDAAAAKKGFSAASTVYIPQLISKPTAELMAVKLPAGEYGEQEGEWMAAMLIETDRLTNRFSVRDNSSSGSFFSKNMSYAEQILHLIPLFESSAFNTMLCSIIQRETDATLLSAALSAAGSIGFDKDSSILTTIQQLVYKQTILTNNRLTQDICDTVYSICKFMGKPALISQGRYILSFLLNQQIDSRTKIYAATTMKKLITLQM